MHTSSAPKDHDPRAARDVEIYRAVFDVNSAVKLLIDPESGTIVDANEAAAAFYGYPKSRLRSMRIGELNVLPDSLIREEMENARTERRTFFRFRHKLASGELRDVEVHSGPFVWNDRTLLLSIIHDVTDRYRLEAKLAQAHTLEAMGRLAGGVAHDFNNLLTVILAFSESIADGSRTGERARMAATHVVQAAQRAAELTQKLLAFGSRRIENPTHLDLNVLLRDLEGVLRGMVGEQACFALDLGADLGDVFADQGPLVQVITNLVRNAGEAIAGRGEVRITTRNATREDGGRVVELTVADTGPGIPPESLPRIFEPFFSTKQRGSGLGLSTVYGIVQQANGAIRVASVPGRTSFTVELPRFDPQDAKGARAGAVAPWTALRVLVAEDDDDVRRAIGEQLTARGHSVVSVCDGEDALAHFESGAPFDVLVTDVRMPRVHGHALATALRAARPLLPVVFVTGHDAGLLDADTQERPFTRVLEKPFSSEALERAILTVFSESERAHAGA